MKDADRADLENALKDAIEKCGHDIERLKDLTKPIPPDNAIGRLTRMEAINEKSINEANLRSTETRLVKLQRALGRVEDEEFGICVECGEKIPVKRLLIVPETLRCVGCAG